MYKNNSLRYLPVSAKTASGNIEVFSFVKSSCRYYFNAQHLFIELSPTARAFFDYLCERMGSTNNYINLNANEREKFRVHMERITNGQIAPSPSSISSYITKLTDLGLIILSGSQRSCFYCINPKYVFKGTEKQRMALLKDLIEDRSLNGLPINMLVNVSKRNKPSKK